MHKKHKPVSSIDGFIPRSSASPTVGFDMVRRRPDTFPGVGMTLSSYSPQPSATPPGTAQATPATPFELPSVSDQPVIPKAKKKRRRLGFKRIALIIFILILIPVGWLGFKFIYNASKAFNGNP